VVADCPWKQSSAHRKGKQNMALVKVLPSQPHLWKDLTHHGYYAFSLKFHFSGW